MCKSLERATQERSQIHKYIYKNTNTEYKIHKYKQSNCTTQTARVWSVPHRKGVKCTQIPKKPPTKVPVASIGNVDDLEGNDDFDDNQENSEIGSKGCMSQIDQA